MKRGNTLPFEITVLGKDLTDAEWVIVSIKPSGVAPIEFDREHMSLSSDGTDTVIVVQLSQEQSLTLTSGEAEIDCNWYMDNARNGAKTVKVKVSRTLLGRVVS